LQLQAQSTVLKMMSLITRSNFHNLFLIFDRSYSSPEDYEYHYNIFKENLLQVESHNQDPNKPYKLGINQFSDWPREKYLAMVRSSGIKSIPKPLTNPKKDSPKVSDVPVNWDWRSQGAVTEVKNQLQCGSSPYFGAICSVEACHWINTGSLISLSEQDIIDCTSNEGNQGCCGGFMTWAFQGIMDMGGVDATNCYPYVGEDDNCSYSKKPPCCASTVGSYVNVTPGDEVALMQAVYLVPVATAVNADLPDFTSYSSGIYSNAACVADQANHGIAIVGYGTDAKSGMDYWILKNSWGTSWGMQGYMYLQRNANDMCGIASLPSYALKCGNCHS